MSFGRQHLKNKFGTGYQIEMKIKNPSSVDDDVCNYISTIIHHLGGINDNSFFDLEQSTVLTSTLEVYLDLEEVKKACDQLSQDTYLSQMIRANDPRGFSMFKLAKSSKGVGVEDLVLFCTEELRVRALVDFMRNSYHCSVLRERQDVRLRFEIPSNDVTISSVFANLEAHKEQLMIEDYGVSQTSLEQIFNFHASEARKHVSETEIISSDPLVANRDLADEAFESDSGLTSNVNGASADSGQKGYSLGVIWSKGARFAKMKRTYLGNSNQRRSADISNISCEAVANNKAIVDIESCDESAPKLAPSDDSSLSLQARKWFPSLTFWKMHRSASDHDPTVKLMPPPCLSDDKEKSNKGDIYNKAIAKHEEKQKTNPIEDLTAQREATEAELHAVSLQKHEVEDKLLALQDERILTSTRLLSTQRKLSSTRDVHETHEMLEQEKKDMLARENKIKADKDAAVQIYEAKIGELSQTFSNEIENIKSKKEEVEDKLTALQDEHVWTISQLSSLQNKLSASAIQYETRMKLEKHKSEHMIELLEAEKANIETKASQLEVEIDANIQEYESKIGDLTLSHSNEMDNFKSQRKEAENKMRSLQDEHVNTSQKLSAAKTAMSTNKLAYENHIKKLENKLQYTTDTLQAKIKALENELVYLRANHASTLPDQAIPSHTASSFSTEIQNISDIISFESDAVALGSDSGLSQSHDRRDEKADQSEFVDINIFDGSSLSSACSSTSYDA